MNLILWIYCFYYLFGINCWSPFPIYTQMLKQKKFLIYLNYGIMSYMGKGMEFILKIDLFSLFVCSGLVIILFELYTNVENRDRRIHLIVRQLVLNPALSRSNTSRSNTSSCQFKKLFNHAKVIKLILMGMQVL